MTVYLAAGLVGVAVALVGYGLVAPEPPHRYGQLSTAASPSATTPFTRLVRPILAFFAPLIPVRAVTDTLDERRRNPRWLLLARSGNPWGLADPLEFTLLRVVTAIGGAALAAGAAIVLDPAIVLAAPLLSLAGYQLPRALLQRHVTRRREETRRALPDFCDLMRAALTANLPAARAFARAVDHMPPGMLRVELQRVVAETRTNRSLRDALAGFAQRTPSEEAESFGRQLVLADRAGIAIDDALTAQADATRQRYTHDMEAMINKMPFLMLVPIMAGALAYIMILLTPFVLQIADFGVV